MSRFGYGGDKSVYTKVGGHDWESKNWYKSDYYYTRLEKIRKKKHKGTARPGTSEYYRRLKDSIAKVHKNLIRENITDLKAEGWTFGVESSKSKGKEYSKFKRQRRIKGTKNKHERVYLKAKDEDDYRNRVLRDQAKLQVFNNLASGWVSEGLTASEGATLDIIINEFQSKTRNPIVMGYARQLGLRVRSKKYGFTSVRRMPLQEKKNILKAARKQFKRHLFTKKTEIVPRSTVDSGGYFTLTRTHNLRQGKTAVQPIILID
jgi:hypothetical protein